MKNSFLLCLLFTAMAASAQQKPGNKRVIYPASTPVAAWGKTPNGRFTPSNAEANRADSAVAALVPTAGQSPLQYASYNRKYFGLIREGKRYIYITGVAYPAHQTSKKTATTQLPKFSAYTRLSDGKVTDFSSSPAIN